MIDYREIDRLRKNPAAFRALALSLLRAYHDDLSEWELEFLELNGRRQVEQFTTLQGEKLCEIRDSVQTVESWRGFNVASLIKGCFEARFDLSEADEDWIVALRARGATSIRRRDAARLLRCARTLNLIETEFA